VLSSGLLARAEIKVVVEHNDNDSATSSFSFKTIPPLAPAHAGTRAQIVLLDGEQDENGAGPEALMDGRLPEGQDEPSGNFFFRSGSDGGRLLLDLRGRTDVKEVNTFSWHPGTRAHRFTLFMDWKTPAKTETNAPRRAQIRQPLVGKCWPKSTLGQRMALSVGNTACVFSIQKVH